MTSKLPVVPSGEQAGVYYRAGAKRWQAFVEHGGKKKAIGSYNTEEEARIAQRKYITSLNGLLKRRD